MKSIGKYPNELVVFFMIIFSLIISSCNHQVDKNREDEKSEPVTEEIFEITKQPSHSVVSYNQSALITCKAESTRGDISYQWYECDDISGKNGKLISEEGSETFETPVFIQKAIKFYYCLVRDKVEERQSSVVAVGYTGLPIMELKTDGISFSSITRESYVPVEFKIIMPDGLEIRKSLTKKGIKGRGNSSWGMPKKGYNLNFDDKESFFNLGKSKKWCIIANYSDKTLLRNKYASVLGNDLFNSEWNPIFIFVDVILNGEYSGNYLFCEKNTIDVQRINIQDLSDCNEKKINNGKYVDKNGDGVIDFYDGGFLMEIDARYDADFYFTSKKNIPFTLKDPDEITEEMLEHITNIVQEAEDTLYADDFSDNLDEDINQSKWMKYCDVDSFVDWYLVSEIGKNRDSCFFSSVYMYYNPNDSKLHLGPIWDFDPAFGNDGENGTLMYLQTSSDWYIKNSKWISRMFEDSRFIERIKTRWAGKKIALEQSFSSDGIIQNLVDEIRVSADLNFIKWPILGSYVWPNASGYEERLTYQSEVDYMKNWLEERYTWLDAAINEL